VLERVSYVSYVLDFAKAFDKVPKKRLLEKVKAVGIGGTVLRWIENWLTGRKQRVVLDGEASGWETVGSGVPQGSVLGPVLFLIFIGDLDRATTADVWLRKFADDTKAANEIHGEKDCENLQEAFDRLLQWADRWGMEFNRQKCKVMHFGNNNGKHIYRMGDHVLEQTEEEKDVGVMVSNNLKPSKHCTKAARTASTVLGQISRAFKYRDKKIFPALYTRYVRPHLEFASPAWSPWLLKDIDILERVQKRAVGMVNGLGGLSYEEKLEALNMETLADRREYADLLLIYKVLNGICTVKKNKWVVMLTRPDQVTRAASDPLKLRKPFARTDIQKNYFTVRICDLWNRLPISIRAAKTVRKFKTTYREFKTHTSRASRTAGAGRSSLRRDSTVFLTRIQKRGSKRIKQKVTKVK
jgi:hypothetical protein